MKKVLNTILIILSIVLVASGAVGAVFGCNYALILLAPAALAMIYPIKTLISAISKKKLNLR